MVLSSVTHYFPYLLLSIFTHKHTQLGCYCFIQQQVVLTVAECLHDGHHLVLLYSVSAHGGVAASWYCC